MPSNPKTSFDDAKAALEDRCAQITKKMCEGCSLLVHKYFAKSEPTYCIEGFLPVGGFRFAKKVNEIKRLRA